MDLKKRAAMVIVLLLLAGGAYWGYRVYFTDHDASIQATGTIEATTVELNAKTPGTIQNLAINAGDSVVRGQLVAVLARNDLVAQRERDALGVAKAEAQLADLESGAREQEKRELAAIVQEARANYDRAAADLARIKVLFEQGAAPEIDYENARTGAELARSRMEAAQARLSLVDSGNRPQQIKAARAEVERSKAVLKATEALLQDLKIYAPISGTVLTKNYENGEFVQMGASLASVADLNDLWIKVYIPTDDLPGVTLGQKVEFTVSGDSTVYHGTVSEIASKGEFTPKTIQTKKERTNVVFGVKIRIDSGKGVLKPGMPADVVFGPGVIK